MNKSADLSLVQGLIILIVVAIVLFGFVTIIQNDIKEKSGRFACQKSVETQSFTKMAGGIISSPFNLNCQKYRVEFFQDHVEIDGKTKKVTVASKTVSKFDGLTNDVVNQVLAQELADCWKQFDVGQIDVFNEKNSDILNHGKACFVCDEVTFNQNVQPVKNQETVKFTGFYDYLKNTQNVALGSTYYQFIAVNSRICDPAYLQGGNCWEGYMTADKYLGPDLHKPITENIEFVKGPKYLIFFVREGLQSWGLDNPHGTYFSYIIPASEINDQCDYEVPSIN